MTIREAYLSAKSWQRKAALIAYYHGIRKYKDKKWLLSSTAKYFSCSIGLVCEAIKLTENMSSVKEFKSRAEALKFLKSNAK